MTGRVRLFSYGTLRDPAVQDALFGRRVAEDADALIGYRLDWIDITDDTVVGLSGSNRHVILHRTGDVSDRIEGAALDLSEAELAVADDYETDAYVRIEVALESGIAAFVYVDPGSVAERVSLG